MTRGEWLVGIDFNPSGDGQVDAIKRRAADLLDCINDIPGQDGGFPEVSRLKALACTCIEEGAMWAVKAATKRMRPDV